MLERKIHEKKGHSLPKELEDNLVASLAKIYNREFQVFSRLYNDEFLLIASFYTDKYLSIFLSIDIDKKVKIDEKLDQLSDILGLVIDKIIDGTEKLEIGASWSEEEVDGEKFFCKISRENIALTLQANTLLDEDF